MPRESQMSADNPAVDLKRTPLYDAHVAAGARMVAFAGYAMPVQYALGVLKEHLQTRAAAGLFDVSHMGQIIVRPHDGDLSSAASGLERLVPVDVAGLAEGRQRYGLLLNARGGIRDDLMIANRGSHLLLIVNAARKHDDLAHLKQHLGNSSSIEMLDRALIALQGAAAAKVLADLAPDCAAMRFMDVRDLAIAGADCVVSRSGYTGEDGFEISVAADQAEDLARALLANPNVAPIGLGARDSLRLEAGLCLHGADITEDITPVEAGLAWAIQPVRRAGGARAGGFEGADVVLRQLTDGPERRRVGLAAEGRMPVRGGAPLYAAGDGGDAIGTVTSGGFGPSVDAPVAMGYVPNAFSAPGRKVFAEVRGKRIAMTVVRLPFTPTRFYRG